MFENQYERYERLAKDKNIFLNSGKPIISALKKAYFGGFVLAPSEKEIEIFW